MGYTRYYTLCHDKAHLVNVLQLILHHNTAEYEDVGEVLHQVKYVEDSSLAALAGKSRKYSYFKRCQFLLIYANGGGRSSTRPFFNDRGIETDDNYYLPRSFLNIFETQEAFESIGWTVVTPKINIYVEGGANELNECIRSHINTLQG